MDQVNLFNDDADINSKLNVNETSNNDSVLKKLKRKNDCSLKLNSITTQDSEHQYSLEYKIEIGDNENNNENNEFTSPAEKRTRLINFAS